MKRLPRVTVGHLPCIFGDAWNLPAAAISPFVQELQKYGVIGGDQAQADDRASANLLLAMLCGSPSPVPRPGTADRVQMLYGLEPFRCAVASYATPQKLELLPSPDPSNTFGDLIRQGIRAARTGAAEARELLEIATGPTWGCLAIAVRGRPDIYAGLSFTAGGDPEGAPVPLAAGGMARGRSMPGEMLVRVGEALARGPMPVRASDIRAPSMLQ